MCDQSLSQVRLFANLWMVAHQAPSSKEFSGQEYWNGLPFPPSGDLPDPGIEPGPPALAGGFFTTLPPGKPQEWVTLSKIYLAPRKVQFRLLAY